MRERVGMTYTEKGKTQTKKKKTHKDSHSTGMNEIKGKKINKKRRENT